MKKMLRGTVLVLSLGLALSAPLWAQYQGRIEGKVLDKTGNPLEKVEVSIVSQKHTGMKFELSTDKLGRFTQIGLRPGYYRVSFKKTGFAPHSVEIKVSIAEATAFDVRLEPAEEAAMRSYSEADKLFLKANNLYAENKFDEAAAAYEEAIKLSQTQWAYYLNLGLAYKKLNRADDAKSAFAKAQELNPSSYSANKELAENLAKSGNFEEAKKYFQKAVELSPDDPDALYNLGVCLINTGESDAALAAFLKCVEFSQDNPDAYYQIGTLYIGQNKVKEALENLEKFLALAPNHEKAGVAKQLVEYLKKQS